MRWILFLTRIMRFLYPKSYLFCLAYTTLNFCQYFFWEKILNQALPLRLSNICRSFSPCLSLYEVAWVEVRSIFFKNQKHILGWWGHVSCWVFIHLLPWLLPYLNSSVYQISDIYFLLDKSWFLHICEEYTDFISGFLFHVLCLLSIE